MKVIQLYDNQEITDVDVVIQPISHDENSSREGPKVLVLLVKPRNL